MVMQVTFVAKDTDYEQADTKRHDLYDQRSAHSRLIGNGRMTSQVLHFQVALSAHLVYFALNTKRPNVCSERLSTGTSIC
jgi:hypothetical protein